MTRRSKIKLIVGIIILAIICFVLYLYTNYSQVVVGAQSAHIQAPTYTVGTTYTGRIDKQFVHEGDQVKSGQTLFYIKSSDLTEQLSQGTVKTSDILYPLTSSGEIILKASKPGTVKDIKYGEDSFVPANSTVATLVNTDQLTVVASVELSPSQYADISSRTRLITTLPSGRTMTEPISDITIQQQGKRSIAQITAKLNGLDTHSIKITDGTPVTATLQIDNSSLWTRLYENIKSYL